MFKKMSLFIDTPVRKRMETDKVFVAMPGLHAAIRFPSEVILAVLKMTRSLGEWELLTLSEHSALQEAVQEAVRIESVIRFWPTSNKVIEIEMKFYRRGQKGYFLRVKSHVDLSATEITYADVS